MHSTFFPGRRQLTALAAVIALIALACLFLPVSLGNAGILLAGLGMAFAVKDVALKVTKALPNGAASITTDGFDLGHSTRGDFLANCELLISAPAVTTTELGDTQTLTYHVEHDDDPAFGTVATLMSSVIVQTGAGGAGAAAATAYRRLPVDVKRYVRVKATKAGASNASTSSVTAELVF